MSLTTRVLIGLMGGFGLGLALAGSTSPAVATLLAVASAAMLSLALEAGQTFLPARIPSNLDVIANVAGAACGGGAAPAQPRGGRSDGRCFAYPEASWSMQLDRGEAERTG
jgi:hypothetical protein